MDLPRALKPWAQELNVFPTDLALSLGPLVQRAALVFGPLSIPGHAPQGSPDGFAGVTRKGSLERLLTSEWLLALDVPDEFIRRVSCGELGYLEIARRQPQGQRRSVLLLDAGPSQLGSPRLAHLALLIVFVRRALAARIQYGWGILQQPQRPLFTSLTEGTIMELLQARGVPEVGAQDVQAWQQQLECWQQQDDVWMVGGSRLTGVPCVNNASLLLVQDVLREGERTVRVAQVRGARTVREVELPLPDGPVCTRLLRDPFSQTRTAPEKSKAHEPAESNLVFSHTGAWLLARAGTGGLVIYPVQRATHGAKPRRLPWEGPAITAAGVVNGRVLAVVVSDEVILLSGTRRHVFREVRRFPHWAGLQLGPAPLRPVIPLPRCMTERGDAWMQDSHGAIHSISTMDLPLFPGSCEFDVAHGMSMVDGCMVAVVRSLSSEPVRVVCVDKSTKVVDSRNLTLAATQFFLCTLGRGRQWPFGSVAFDTHPQWWTVLCGDKKESIRVDEGSRVCGITHRTWGGPGLVVLDGGGERVYVLRPSQMDLLFEEPEGIEQLVVSPTGREVAYATRSGAVVARCLERKMELFRVKSWEVP